MKPAKGESESANESCRLRQCYNAKIIVSACCLARERECVVLKSTCPSKGVNNISHGLLYSHV